MKKLFILFVLLNLIHPFAQASNIVESGYFGGVGNTSGVDGLGHEWSYDTNDEGTRLIWTMPEIGSGGAVFSGSSDIVNGFYIEFSDPSIIINMLPSAGLDDEDFRTRFMVGGSLWDVVLKEMVDAVRVDFLAPGSSFINFGDEFSISVVFDYLYNPSIFSFTAGWLHIDQSGGGSVVEPSGVFLILFIGLLFLSRARIFVRSRAE